MTFTIVTTAWGCFGFVARGRRLVATLLPQPEREIRRAIAKRWPEAVEAHNRFPELRKQISDYFAGKRVRFDVDVDLSDLPPFQQGALKACRKIPYGKTASYADLARASGNPAAARAVGGAMARNPLPLVIPCHRVLRSDGSLGGFSSRRGIKEKERLLRLERAWPVG